MKKQIIIAGLGPGGKEDITPAVIDAVRRADAIVGYKYYFRFVEDYLKADCTCIDTGMRHERERAEQAFNLAETGKTVVVISSMSVPVQYDIWQFSSRGRIPGISGDVDCDLLRHPSILK